MRKHLLPTSLLLLACAAAAPAAHADSIAYVKDNDAWLASPDGSRQQRVTTSGDVYFVSQADDGTMIALVGGEKLRKLSPTGKTLAEFPTYVSDGGPQSGPVNQFGGPFNPEISPDGKLVAFEWFNNNYDSGNTSNCSSTSSPPCYVLTSHSGVGITNADAFTGFEAYGLMTGWIGPQWLGNDRLLRSDANAALNEDTVFTGVKPGGGDDDLDRWFWDNHEAYGLREARLTRDHKAAAGIAGYTDDRLRVYRTVVEPFGAPDQDLGPWAASGSEKLVEPCFELTADAESKKFENLTFSPDGRHLVFSAADGVYVADLPDLGAGCANATAITKVIPGGHHPHWGPADIPPASAFAQVDQPKTDGPVAPGGDTTTTIAAKARKSTSKRIVVDVTASTAGQVKLVAKRGAKTVAKATRGVAAGKTRIALKVTKAGRRALRHGGTVKVNVTLAGATTSVKVKVRH
jgi:hypothetical protein